MRQNERKRDWKMRSIYDDNTDDHLFKDPVLYYMEPE